MRGIGAWVVIVSLTSLFAFADDTVATSGIYHCVKWKPTKPNSFPEIIRAKLDRRSLHVSLSEIDNVGNYRVYEEGYTIRYVWNTPTHQGVTYSLHFEGGYLAFWFGDDKVITLYGNHEEFRYDCQKIAE